MTISSTITKTRLATAFTALAGALCVSSAVVAQQARGSAGGPESYVAVVTADNTALRSGASKSYYHFATLNEGDLVHVTGSKFMWSKVEATGPVFDALYGLIKLKKDDAPRLSFSKGASQTRRTAVTLGRTEVYAPNAATKDPLNGVWKALTYLPPDTQVTVIETINTDAEVFHKVVLPETAVGWISSASLRRADAAEIDRWQRMLAGERLDPAPALTTPAPATKATTPAVVADTRADLTVPDTAIPTIPAPVLSDSSADNPPPLLARDVAPEPIVAPRVERPVAVAEPAADELSIQAAADAADVADVADTTDSEKTMTAALAPSESVRIATPATTDTTGPSTPTAAADTPAPTRIVTMDAPEIEPVRELATEPQPTPTESATSVAANPLTDENVTLQQLEGAFSRLQNEPIETAELAPLQRLYVNYADRHRDDSKQRASYADARAEQLRIWSELQQQRLKIENFRAELSVTSEDIRAFADRTAREGGYTAVGRLAASSIYDGRDLPNLLRLQDPASGRTIAYLQTRDSAVDLLPLVDQLIGVIGAKQYDNGLRIHLIQPTQVDLLAPDAIRARQAAPSAQKPAAATH